MKRDEREIEKGKLLNEGKKWIEKDYVIVNKRKRDELVELMREEMEERYRRK